MVTADIKNRVTLVSEAFSQELEEQKKKQKPELEVKKSLGFELTEEFRNTDTAML